MSAPTEHQLAAALQVARFIDASGNPQFEAHSAYVFTATDDSFVPSALRSGEALLIQAGLLRLTDGVLTPTSRLANVARMANRGEAVVALADLLIQTSDEDGRAETGALGEEFVLGLIRDNLIKLHRMDLAERCERVSLVSDRFGYDLIAPRLDAQVRRLEVKTQTVDQGRPVVARFYLTRHEYDVGRSNPTEWALVACAKSRSGDPLLLGWCRASTLAAYLPADQSGRWTEALVQIPTSVLTAGFPSAV